jgi:hypothetical protein
VTWSIIQASCLGWASIVWVLKTISKIQRGLDVTGSW